MNEHDPDLSIMHITKIVGEKLTEQFTSVSMIAAVQHKGSGLCLFADLYRKQLHRPVESAGYRVGALISSGFERQTSKAPSPCLRW